MTFLNSQVDYIDSSSDENKPVILCLHSTPGSIYDFKKLITYFGLNPESDYRVVVPRFPGFDFTEQNDCFYHSALERAQFIRDFISQLNINEIECLVVHSSSIYSASYLWMEDDPFNCPIKSLALFNCPGPGIAHKKLWNAFLFNNMMRFNFLKNKLIGGGQWSKIGRNDKVHYLLTIYLSDFMTMPQRLEALKQFKIPTLAVVSHQDELYSQELFYQILHFLGAQIDHFDVYEKYNNKLVQSNDVIDWLKVVNIQGGDNQCFISHSFIVHKYLQDLLNRIKDDQSKQKLLTNLN